MIIRKPYAFIIKHFKLIHLIILGCLAYGLYNLGGIGNLASTLINSRTYTYSGADVYINKSVYFFLFIALFLSVVLFWLLRQKKKPIGLYIGLIVYIIFEMVMYAIFFNTLTKLMNELVEIDTLSFMRDMVVLVRLPGYVFIGLCFIRGIGFNIKQFNFSKDIEELKIADKDSEEFELMVGQNNYKYERFIRRTIREAKYYILENKVSITIIFLAILLIGAFFGYKFYKQYMSKIKAREVTILNGISYTVNKAYITAENHQGDKIKPGSKFLIIDMSFNNTTNDKKVLDIDKFRLVNKQLYYNATQSYNSNFYDLGLPYERDTQIPSETMLNRFIVFELPEQVVTTNFVLRYDYGVTSKKDKVLAEYIKFDINAKNIDTEDQSFTTNLNENISPNVNNENKFDISIKGFSVKENYNDKYVLCDRNLVCNTYNSLVTANSYNRKTMLVLDIKGLIYEDAKFTQRFKTYNDIFNEFAYIEYDSNSLTNYEKVTTVPRSNIEDKIFCLVDRKITDSKHINLIFHFRNQTYTVPLK